MKPNKTLKPLFTALGIGFFVAYVLIVFQPFGTDGFQHPHKNLFVAVFVTLYKIYKDSSAIKGKLIGQPASI
ncbi:MAG: hypothetical protein JEZ14_01760 [Marinilabiliaceae bacterium]|nr:hypothetical protein [Marinilabiliaceae bacterium]